MVVDHLTGLMWVRSGDSQPSAGSWQDALDFSNSLSLCGNHFTTWTSTTSVYETSTAFYVWASYGWLDPTSKWTGQTGCWHEDGAAITCAGTGQDGDVQRGEPWPEPRFVDNGDGTVDDLLTGLTWLQGANCVETAYGDTWPAGFLDWSEVMDFVAGVDDGSYGDFAFGRADWRVPNRIELRSLMDYSQSNVALPVGHPFTNIPDQLGDYNHWSSTSYGYPIDAPDEFLKNWDDVHVWPVAGGILGDTGDPGDGGANEPDILVEPTSLDFGGVEAQHTRSLPVTITNVGSDGLVVGEFGLQHTVGSMFTIRPDVCGMIVMDAGESCTFYVWFRPPGFDDYVDAFDIPSNDPDQPEVIVSLSGSGYAQRGCWTCSTGSAAGAAAWAIGLLATLVARRRRSEGDSG